MSTPTAALRGAHSGGAPFAFPEVRAAQPHEQMEPSSDEELPESAARRQRGGGAPPPLLPDRLSCDSTGTPLSRRATRCRLRWPGFLTVEAMTHPEQTESQSPCERTRESENPLGRPTFLSQGGDRGIAAAAAADHTHSESPAPRTPSSGMCSGPPRSRA